MSDHIVFSQIEFAAATKDGFSDVSIMTKGEARGHEMMVDEKTIEQFMQLSIGKSVPAYLTHEGATDAEGRPKDRLGKEIGMFSGFYRDGDRVRARNFKFLDSFKQAEPKIYSTLLELAKEFSDKLGISPVVGHFKAWLLKDGSEVLADGKGIPSNLASQLPVMRLGSLLSCDFVQKPATNLGLFQAIDVNPTKEKQLMSDTIALSEHTKALDAIKGELKALSTQHKDAIAALEAKHVAALSAKDKENADLRADLAKSKEELSKQTAALAAKASEAEEAAKYDMRRAGAPALAIALETKAGAVLPAPAATDSARWEQYATLCEVVKDDRGTVINHKETPAAKLFKDKYLKK